MRFCHPNFDKKLSVMKRILYSTFSIISMSFSVQAQELAQILKNKEIVEGHVLLSKEENYKWNFNWVFFNVLDLPAKSADTNLGQQITS